MKPDWDTLMAEHPAVFDVDCTAAGKALCEEVGVTGFPTIKHGDASDKKSMENYEGGRDLASLKEFAEKNLAPMCGPDALDACSAEQKTMLEGFMKRSAADLTAEVKKLEKEFAAKQKKIDKKKSKFAEKRRDFEEDHAEQKSAKPKKGKEAAHEAKMKKLDEKVEKMNAEQRSIEGEMEALKKEEEKSGVKLMKAAAKSTKVKTDL